jgi:hypothetical protein
VQVNRFVARCELFDALNGMRMCRAAELLGQDG